MTITVRVLGRELLTITTDPDPAVAEWAEALDVTAFGFTAAEEDE